MRMSFMMNKNAVYVVKQPEHPIVTVVLVNSSDLPLSNQAHQNIDALSTISDIVFVFSEHFKTSDVDIRKFASLYGATAYMLESGPCIGLGIFRALAYCQGVFQSFAAYILTDTIRLREVGSLGQSKLEKIQEITMSPISKPIMNITRLSAEELGNIYLRGDTRPDPTPFWMFWKSHDNYDTEDRINSTHKSASKFLYFKVPVIKALLTRYEDKEFQAYLRSFSEDDFTFLIASFIKKLDLDNLDADIINLEFNGE